jgi:Xaa-Pro aminopeptidase
MTRPLSELDLPAVRSTLAELNVDGWLLFDFHGLNPVAQRLIGASGLATRRIFVWIPRAGDPVALAHRIELSGLAGFPGAIRPYAAWRELHQELRALVGGKRVAMEVSPQDAVPYLDRVPAGVLELVQASGATVTGSGVLVTRFAATWSAAELDGHRRAAEALARIADEALRWAGAEVARGAEVREVGLQRRVLDAMERGGLVTTHPPIAAFQQNAALPHYEPHEGEDRRLAAGQVILLDLWAGPAAGSVFADQTWMAFAGRAPDAEVRRVWEAVRDARDAAVALLRQRWGARAAVTGADVDDAARAVIRGAGFGEFFTHRTGHSIDRDLHGSGPHIDNFETHDERTLMPGIGFSIEPGIYLAGRFGMRSEINVYCGADGPEVTPAAPQRDLLLV